MIPTTPAAPPAIVQTVQVGGCRINLSSPILIRRAKGYLWFPGLMRAPDGRLFAVMQAYPDMHTRDTKAVLMSSVDDGVTWDMPLPLSQSLCSDSLALPNGDLLVLPYYMDPKPDGMGAPYGLIRKGRRDMDIIKEGVVVTGWPRKPGSFSPECGYAGFVFTGQVIKDKDDRYLTTLYGYFDGETRYATVVATSPDGVHWTVRGIVADGQSQLKGDSGPSEAALCRLKDGRLMCVFRMSNGARYGQSWSSDEGAHWSEPVAMARPYSVEPSLQVLDDGAVLLSGGRPGLFLWLNRAGDGKEWEAIDIMAHHDRCWPMETLHGNGYPMTSSYTEIVRLDRHRILYIYDRIPTHGYEVPETSPESDSVWVVQLTID